MRTGNGPVESCTRVCHAVACPNQEFPAFMYSPLCLLSSHGQVIEVLSSALQELGHRHVEALKLLPISSEVDGPHMILSGLVR